MKIRNVVLLYGLSMIVGLYTTFVLTMLWDWFVVPSFHLSPISFWVMYGLTLLIGLLGFKASDFEGEQRHKVVAVMLDACVPDHKRAEVKEELAGFSEGIWYEAGSKVLAQVGGTTFTLVFGYVIHAIAS